MAISAVQSGSLAWLMTCLAGKRARVMGLLQRLSGMGQMGTVKPALLRKFLDLLDEVAVAKDEESGLISRIEAIELKHRFMRTHKKLRLAGPPAKKAANDLGAGDNLPAKAKRSFAEILLLLILWLIVLWNMFPRLFPKRGINQKKQGLTAD